MRDARNWSSGVDSRTSPVALPTPSFRVHLQAVGQQQRVAVDHGHLAGRLQPLLGLDVFQLLCLQDDSRAPARGRQASCTAARSAVWESAGRSARRQQPDQGCNGGYAGFSHGPSRQARRQGDSIFLRTLYTTGAGRRFAPGIRTTGLSWLTGAKLVYSHVCHAQMSMLMTKLARKSCAVISWRRSVRRKRTFMNSIDLKGRRAVSVTGRNL